MLAKINNLKPVILLVSTLFSFNLYAAHVLPEFNAKYAIQKLGLKVAEAHYQLNYTDSGYKFTQNTHL